LSTSHSLPSTSTPAGNRTGSNFVQLARTPLVPESILKSHGAFCVIDTRFRAAARLLQCLWLRDHDIPTAASVTHAASSSGGGVIASDHSPPTAFGSILSPEAANTGRNFLSPAIHRLALQEWLMCEEDAAIDDERLFGNALSSMPLAFNLFGPLALDSKLATSVFRALLPDFVHTVERITWEHSPGRRDNRFLSDRSAVDIAVHVTTCDGGPGTIYIEVKYSESMEGPAARMRDRYNEASKQVRLFRDADSPILRSNPIEQIWREHMLSQLAVDNGFVSRAVFMAIGPRLNRRAHAAFRVYQAELIDIDHLDSDRVPFVPMTLESVIEALATAGASEHARALWDRYCDFDRVYRLSMHQLAGNIHPTPADSPSQMLRKQAPPSARRAPASTNARRARVASSRTRGNTGAAKREVV
jgi:hypothetical protein